jgi:site-specific DNA-adenine methylase
LRGAGEADTRTEGEREEVTMWSYYGSKSNIVHLYPSPKFDKIIEPFAGGAAYSLQHFDRDVLLVDKYEVIVKIWKWLQKCSKQDILGLPRLKQGERLSSYKWDCEEARLMMGFIIAKGSFAPRDKAAPGATSRRPNHINFTLKKIARQLDHIRHWKIQHGSYQDIENQEATWFIDPPYVKGGECYPESNKKINYNHLSSWCKDRFGHVIVCENMSAGWMPFYPMVKNAGIKFVTTEAIWSNYPHDYMATQPPLFE